MPMMFPKSRQEWLEIRRQYVSSTESSALFGMSPYTTAFELAVEKKSKDELVEWEGNERTAWGLRLQRTIAEAVAQDYGVKVRAISGYMVHPDRRMGASFDYEIVGIKDDWKGEDSILRDRYAAEGAGVLEIKNVDSLVFKNDWQKVEREYDPPAHIELQVQHQLECIARKWACIAVLVGGNRQVIVLRGRDWAVGEAIKEKVNKFYRVIEKGGMPPLNLPQDVDAIKKLYKHAEPGSVRDYQGENRDEALAAMCAKVIELGKVQKAALDAYDSAKAELLFTIGTAEKVLFDEYSISAGTVGPVHIDAHERQGYRNLRVYAKKRKEDGKTK